MILAVRLCDEFIIKTNKKGSISHLPKRSKFGDKKNVITYYSWKRFWKILGKKKTLKKGSK